jgi:hypothetical protein
MAISSIIQQPESNSLHAAYRPVLFRVVADGSTPPPVVYCDIYFNGVYYRTISKTVYAKLNTSTSEWLFDIQGPAQEYVKHFLATNGGGVLSQAVPIMARTFCRFRASDKDPDGFIIIDGTMPVQGTATKKPISGTGMESNSCFILNATLQHEDNQILPTHLSAFKTGTWADDCYPVTHRPTQSISIGNSDYFPIITDGEICITKLILNYKLKTSSSFVATEIDINDVCDGAIASITTSQVPATTNINVSWEFTGSPTSFDYRVDGGVWINTTETTIVLTGLAVGPHNIEVRPICSCATGTSLLKSFTVGDVSTTCNSVVTIESITATGDREITIVFSSTGPATNWRYRLNGGSNVAITSTTLVLTDLSFGSQSIVIEPVCDDFQIGVGDSEDFIVEADNPSALAFSVRLTDIIEGHCGAIETTAYSDSFSFGAGIILYIDPLFITPIGGYNFVSISGSGTIHTIDPFTGEVGAATSNSC